MIGILTFHQVYNYGAVLQAYGLQQYLIESGFEVEIINIETFKRPKPSKQFPRLSRKYFRYCLKLLFDSEFKKFRSESVLKAKRFDEFRNNYLNLTEKYSDLDELFQKRDDIDVLIVGSDQIWNPKFGRLAMETYFLKTSENIKKISYASCIGSEIIDFNYLDNYINLVKEFDGVSSRDNFTNNYVIKNAKIDTSLVVDPSLLINWEYIPSIIYKYNLPTDYIFVYGASSNTENLLVKLKDELNLPIIMVGMEDEYESHICDIILNDIGPLEWLELIRNASFVVTKSFHGLMFSLKFERQVFVISNGYPAISRLADICERLSIEHIIIENKDDYEKLDNFNVPLNYKNVNQRINLEIEKSKNFLLNTINN